MNPNNVIILIIGAYLSIGAYLLGSIHFGLIAGKIKGIDVRKGGSGNVGTTNVFRLLGKKWGFIVFLLDTAKGWLPVFLAIQLTSSATVAVLVAGAAILGHTFSFFMYFKGGKGVATGLGTIIALIPTLALVAFVMFGLVLMISKTVSLASLSAVTSLLLMIFITDQPTEYRVFVVLGAILIFYAHRSNIVRLINGTENRLGR